MELALLEKLNDWNLRKAIEGNRDIKEWKPEDRLDRMPKEMQKALKEMIWNPDLTDWDEPSEGVEPEIAWGPGGQYD